MSTLWTKFWERISPFNAVQITDSGSLINLINRVFFTVVFFHLIFKVYIILTFVYGKWTQILAIFLFIYFFLKIFFSNDIFMH